MKKRVSKTGDASVAGYDTILSGLVDLLENARRVSARAVNSVMTASPWGFRKLQSSRREDAFRIRVSDYRLLYPCSDIPQNRNALPSRRRLAVASPVVRTRILILPLYPGDRMSVIDSIVRDLRELPPPKLMEVARYVHGLNPKSHERRSAALLATAGCMAGEEGEDFERAVRAEADRIDGDAW